MDRELYKHSCGLYLADAMGWQERKFGPGIIPKGDVIHTTMTKIIDDNDDSDWAKDAIKICVQLLQEGKRWPDSLNQPDIRGFQKYRSQTGMTRDPYIGAITSHMKMYGKVSEGLSIPWYLWTPRTWNWHKYLKTGKMWRLNLYDRFKPKEPHKKDFVNVLRNQREIAINYKLLNT